MAKAKKLKVTKDGWEIVGEGLVEGFELIQEENGISSDEIYEIFRESLERGLLRQLGGGNDAIVEVNVDRERKAIQMFHVQEVVETVEDDYLQVQLDEVIDVHPDAKIGDHIKTQYLLNNFTIPAVKVMMNTFNQKIIEAEKKILFEVYKDKVDQIITGIVEKVDGNNLYVDIGKTSVRLTPRDLIGNEHYEVGSQIKVYVDRVSETGKGARIEVSRSHPGFLRKLFEEEIPEIYEHSVLIKNDEPANAIYGVVREAGLRAKVAVYTNVPNVDPVATCIGPNASRIQKIVAQLGNGRLRENVDVIQYSRNPVLFIADALKPAEIKGVIVNEILKTATVIVPDDQVSVLIGLRGSNIRLAQLMTGYKIEVLKDSDAVLENIEYDLVSDVLIEDRRQQELLRQSELQERRRIHAEQMSRLEDSSSTVEVDEKQLDDAEEKAEIEEVIEEVPTVVIEETIEEVPTVAVEEPEERESVVITTTTTLEDLEKQLEAEKNQSSPISQDSRRKPVTKKPAKKAENETPTERKTYEKMEIYSEDELQELEAFEEEVDDYDDIDLEDFEDYYDED